MTAVLWVVQVVLAAAFALSGLVKIGRSKERLAGPYPWTRDFSQSTVRFIGVMEVLGALGLVLPAATGITPVLTPIAATGLAVLVALAAALHLRRGESSGIAVTAVLFVLAALVAWGRFGPYGW